VRGVSVRVECGHGTVVDDDYPHAVAVVVFDSVGDNRTVLPILRVTQNVDMATLADALVTYAARLRRGDFAVARGGCSQ
jgi:hypothetical protein